MIEPDAVDGATASGWLIESYSEARAVLASPVFSSDIGAYDPEEPGRQSTPTPAGFFINMNPPDHTRYRRSVARYFTVAQTNHYQGLIEDLATARLREVEMIGPPADLSSGFIYPVPFQIMCNILGVPLEAQSDVQQLASRLTDMRFSASDSKLAHLALIRFFSVLALADNLGDSDGLLRRLAVEQTGGYDLSPEDIGGIGVMLLNAGHETTSGVFALGLIELFKHPEQIDYLRRNVQDEIAVTRTAEEMIRFCSPLRYGIPRISTAAVEVGGKQIRPGDLVTISTEQVNRDRQRFMEARNFDILADRPRHLAFGHGIHQCLGSALARLELTVMIRSLFTRLPRIQPVIPPAQIPLLQHTLLRGTASLPVTW